MEVNPGVQKPEQVSVKKEVKEANDSAALKAKLDKLKLEVEIKELQEKLAGTSKAIVKATVLVPNMLEDAEKTVSDYKGVTIPTGISSIEKGYYHMLCIVSEADQKTKKFTFAQRVVKFSVPAYSRHKNNYSGVKEEEWVMFHNPTLVKKG